MIDLLAHFFISSVIGLLFWLGFGNKNRKNLFLFLAFGLLAGFFVDIDHVFDYLMAYGFVWNFGHFIHEDYFNDSGHNFVLLHDFELVFLLGLIAFFLKNKKKRIYFSIMAITLFLHILIDIILAGGSLKSYFLIYRILTGFQS